MEITRLKKQYFITILLSAFITINCFGQINNSNQSWQQYTQVHEVGFSLDSLKLLSTELSNSNSEAVMVIYKGNVLFSYGDISRRYAIHSMRKSIMNAMIGIEVQKGTLNLSHSLDDFDIDDIGALTSNEKRATLKDLLSARGGIYHPSAYYERSLVKMLPHREAYPVGSQWVYNNWDFNVLHTIYEQQTGKNFFKSFESEIANPIGMEDFRAIDTYLRLEEDKSVHPAYLFKMSSRDLARFGLLYLNQGKWKNNQIIPSEWVKASTSIVTKSEDLGSFKSKGSYGLLWWIDAIDGREIYYASGAGGHRVIVIPEEQMVIVHRVNTYEGVKMGVEQINRIVSTILSAKSDEVITNNSPSLTPLISQSKPVPISLNRSMDQFIGTYKHRFFGEMNIRKQENVYQLQNGIGIFNLFVTSDTTFYIEDMETPIRMAKKENPDQKITIKPVMSKDKKLEEVVFYY